MTSSSLPANDDDITLEPRPWVALGVIALGATCLLLRPLWGGAAWLALAVAVLGLFLLLQTALLRLRFSADALVVLRQESEIRRFPYAAWIGWRVFWPAVPVLFYFREQRSIHLLPMLFDATMLRSQLEQRLAPPAPKAPQAPPTRP
jgi:hypothetical protein